MSSKGWSIGADAGAVVISKGAEGDYDSETSKRSLRGFVFGEKGFIADLPLERIEGEQDRGTTLGVYCMTIDLRHQSSRCGAMRVRDAMV
jgi:hypothetical protein